MDGGVIRCTAWNNQVGGGLSADGLCFGPAVQCCVCSRCSLADAAQADAVPSSCLVRPGDRMGRRAAFVTTWSDS